MALVSIVAVALIALAVVLERSWSRQSLPTTQKALALPPATSLKSIAVLPFKPLAAKNRDEVLEIGMADTLINRLSGMKEVIVRPIRAVRRYTDLGQDAVAAGKELKVDTVLEGNIQRIGNQVRLTLRLVRTSGFW